MCVKKHTKKPCIAFLCIAYLWKAYIYEIPGRDIRNWKRCLPLRENLELGSGLEGDLDCTFWILAHVRTPIL